MLPVVDVVIPMKGRLHKFTSNWELVTSDPWVLNMVRGYMLEFLQLPQNQHPNHCISLIKKAIHCGAHQSLKMKGSNSHSTTGAMG